MVKEDGYNISDTGNWNVASDYSRLKIMKPLDFCDHYENIAKFGYDSIMEELDSFNLPNDVLRLTGFKRLISELLKLINNARFSMKTDGTRKKLEEYEKNLNEIYKIIPLLSKTINNQIKKTNKIIIRDDMYDKALSRVLEIKSLINEPLNKNHLIFTDKKEFDPKAYKDMVIEGATHRG